jgi:hypothetical protein
MSNSEFCHAHARAKVVRDCAAGLKVYDDREGPRFNRGLANEASLLPSRATCAGVTLVLGSETRFHKVEAHCFVLAS